jgi:hypothetical protein
MAKARIGQVFIPTVPLDEDAPSRPQPGAPSAPPSEDTGPLVEMLPALMRPGSDGVLDLPAGLYLVDTDTDHWRQAWPVMIEQFGKQSLRELLLLDDRNMALATFYLAAPARTSLATPIYAVEPDNATLRGIARRLGYEEILEPVGVLEWAATNFPGAYRAAVSAAEKVAFAGSDVAGLLKFVGAAAGVAFVVQLFKRK